MKESINRMKNRPFGSIGIIGCCLMVFTAIGSFFEIIPQNIISYLLITSTILALLPTVSNKLNNK